MFTGTVVFRNTDSLNCVCNDRVRDLSLFKVIFGKCTHGCVAAAGLWRVFTVSRAIKQHCSVLSSMSHRDWWGLCRSIEIWGVWFPSNLKLHKKCTVWLKEEQIWLADLQLNKQSINTFHTSKHHTVLANPLVFSSVLPPQEVFVINIPHCHVLALLHLSLCP